ncbi:hypothetical protein Salat_2601400, partial [Sesamum alatum]
MVEDGARRWRATTIDTLWGENHTSLSQRPLCDLLGRMFNQVWHRRWILLRFWSLALMEMMLEGGFLAFLRTTYSVTEVEIGYDFGKATTSYVDSLDSVAEPT